MRFFEFTVAVLRWIQKNALMYCHLSPHNEVPTNILGSTRAGCIVSITGHFIHKRCTGSAPVQIETFPVQAPGHTSARLLLLQGLAYSEMEGFSFGRY